MSTIHEEGRDLVAGILERKAASDAYKAAFDAYEAAEDAWTKALQAAVANHGDWAYVQQAHVVVKQTQAALRALEERTWNL